MLNRSERRNLERHRHTWAEKTGYGVVCTECGEPKLPAGLRKFREEVLEEQREWNTKREQHGQTEQKERD